MSNPYHIESDRYTTLLGIFEALPGIRIKTNTRDFLECVPVTIFDCHFGVYPDENCKLLYRDKNKVVISDNLGPNHIKRSLNRFVWEIGRFKATNSCIEVIYVKRNSFSLKKNVCTEKILYYDGWTNCIKCG